MKMISPYTMVTLVEDDVHMRTMMKYLVESLGFKTLVYSSGEEFLSEGFQNRKSIFIFDNNLPGITGLQLTQLIRKEDKVSPILMISGESDEVIVINALDVGADDYILKPFSTNLISAKIKNLQARTTSILDRLVDIGIKFIDDSHTVLFNEYTISFTSREFQIFKALYDSQDRTSTREHLLNSIGEDTTIRNIDVIVCSIRKKLESLPIHIQSLRGKGYFLELAS
jgi:DNA-binding response OmpR family regulator